jgi:hypothetical protein
MKGFLGFRVVFCAAAAGGLLLAGGGEVSPRLPVAAFQPPAAAGAACRGDVRPAAWRVTSRERQTLLAVLAEADRALGQGRLPQQVLAAVRGIAIADGIEVEGAFLTARGTGFRVRLPRATTFVYWSASADGVTALSDVARQEEGVLDGRHFAAYEGGDEPPIPPIRSIPPGGAPAPAAPAPAPGAQWGRVLISSQASVRPSAQACLRSARPFSTSWRARASLFASPPAPRL